MIEIDKILEIEYNNNNDEISESMKKFQKKFGLKRNVIMTVVYTICLGLLVDLAVRNTLNLSPSAGIIYYIGSALCLAMIFNQWYKPYSARRKVLKTLESFSEEKYIARFYKNKIEIETEILPENETETVAITSGGIIPVEEGSEAEKEGIEIPKTANSVYEFNSTMLSAEETNDMFLLYVERSFTHIFPKRCLSDEEQGILRNYLDDKSLLD